jgi:hypothetical protein
MAIPSRASRKSTGTTRLAAKDALVNDATAVVAALAGCDLGIETVTMNRPPGTAIPPTAPVAGLREDYMKHRPNVERAVAQVATWRGRRLKLRYRGTARNYAWLKRRTAALNLRNLLGKGLTRRDGTWVLAT